MAEIADPWILDPEGFWFRFVKTEGFWFKFVKTEGFWKGNRMNFQLFKGNISFHSHFFTDFEKNCTDSK